MAARRITPSSSSTSRCRTVHAKADDLTKDRSRCGRGDDPWGGYSPARAHLSGPSHATGPCRARAGMTLVELAVVVVILATVAAVVTFKVSTAAAAAGDGATRASMAAIRAAIVGGDAGGGYVADVRKKPRKLSEL